MKSVDEYLKKYGSIDEEIKRRYGTKDDSGFYYLENQDSWRYMKDDLYYCRDKIGRAHV